MEALLSGTTTLAFGDAEARAAGALRAALRKQGTPIGAYDVLIAGTALVEFRRVGGLAVEDWRE